MNKLKNMELLKELSNIHDRCIKLIEERNHTDFIEFTSKFLEEKDGIPKMNKLKTILVVSKNVPNFFPEIKEIREKILLENNRQLTLLGY